MAKIDLSIIIVNFNTKTLLIKLLDSIRQSGLGNFRIEIIVVDNCSVDDSVLAIRKLFPKTKKIINDKNQGFAKANNKGIKISLGRYVLFLNSDTLIREDTIAVMIKFMDENPKAAAATCRVELPNGKIDPACHRGFPTPWAAFTYFSGLEMIFPQNKAFGQYHQTWKNFSKTHKVDVISGAFFMIRKEILEQIGLFDERYFMYGEDIDLCYRIRKKGHDIYFNPNTKIIHYKTSSGRKKHKGNKITRQDLLIKNIAKKHFFETMKLFYDKYYKNKYPWIIRQLVLLGIKIISRYKE